MYLGSGAALQALQLEESQMQRRKQIPHIAAGDVSTTEEIELGDTAGSGRGPGYSEWLGGGVPEKPTPE